MKKVVIQFEDVVRTYNDVTKVQFFKESGHNSYFVIFQGKEKNVVMVSEISGNGLEIIDC